jgi:hypothetical protein
MFSGVLIFERVYPVLKVQLLTDLPTNLTLAQLLHVSHWVVFASLFVVAVLLVALLKRYRL